MESAIKAVETLRTISNVLERLKSKSKKGANLNMVPMRLNQTSGDLDPNHHQQSVNDSILSKDEASLNLPNTSSGIPVSK